MADKGQTKRFKFSISAIDKLAAPSAGREVYMDDGCDNLAVVVSPASKRFYWIGRSAGRATRLFIGKFPAMGVEAARKKCRALSVARDEGRDAAAERRQKRQEPTLAELWESYLELHAKPRKKTWKDDERQYDKYLAPLHGKRLSTITQAMIAKWHGGIAKDHGPIQANRCKALLATMFSKASAAVGYSGPNPAVGVANFPERSRERFLLPAEMKAFFTALAAEDPYWQAFFLIAIFTGSRRGNIASMEWAEVDLENALWHIPQTKTKNKRPTTVALCSPALAILKTRHEQRNGSNYVFPAFKGDGHVIDPRKAWDRIKAAMRQCPHCSAVIGSIPKACPECRHRLERPQANCPECNAAIGSTIKECPECRHQLEPAESINLRMHDLRRTQGSWQAGLGVSLAIIGKSLGHADLKSTQVYSRLQLDPVKDAVSRASGAMVDAAGAGVQIGVNGVELFKVELNQEEYEDGTQE